LKILSRKSSTLVEYCFCIRGLISRNYVDKTPAFLNFVFRSRSSVKRLCISPWAYIAPGTLAESKLAAACFTRPAAETWVDPVGCPVDNDLPEVEVPNPNNPGTPGDGGTNPNPGTPGDTETPGDTGTPNDGSGGDTPGDGSGSTGGTSYIYNLVDNPCLSGMVDAIVNSDITFKANETLQSIFGWSGHFNIKFMESTKLADDVMGNAQATRILYDADGKITDMDVTVLLNVKNLPGASREYIAMVIAHESVHAYLNYQGYSYNTNQHDLMLSQY